MRKILVALTLTLLFTQFCHAQKISDMIQSDTLVHVYKLNYEQTKFILQSKIIVDTPFLFTKKYKEYSIAKFKNDTLPEGNYLIAKIMDQTIYYEYYYKTPFLIYPKVINEDVILYFSDKKNKALLKNAKIEVDGVEAKYDAGYGGYSFTKKSVDIEKLQKNEVFLKISYQGEIYVYPYQIIERPKPVARDNYYDNRYATLNSPGYLLLDKPIYKPLDSLNIKAFLIDYKNGNPIRKKASLYISEPQQKFYFSKQLKKKTPGAYLYTWQLPDTLKLDRYYNVELRYKKRGRTLVKKANFKLEEYELAKNKYELDMPNEMFFAGDDITFFTTATDMNGFPVQGTRVHYNLRIDEILEIFTDSLTVSAAQKRSWLAKDTIIEYDTFIETKIPSATLPKANARYTLEVTFTDPITYEKKVISKQFLKYTQKEKLLFYQQKDSIHIRNLYNNKDTNKAFYFITLSGNDTISRKKIFTPFHYKLNPMETSVCILDKDSIKQTLTLQYNKLDITQIKGKRTGDSIMISFTYPFAEPVHYKIYKKDKVIKSGASSQLRFTALDQSIDEYRILLTTNLQNHIEDNFYELKFVPEKDMLHYKNTIPKSALPGDSIAVEVTALDYKNQPRKKVNIAAYAINAAFTDDIETPYIDVPEIYKNKVSVEPIVSTDKITLKAEMIKTNHEIKNHHFSRFNLRKNEYYLLKYPLKELSEITIHKQQAKPEFAVVVTHQNRLYAPKYILVDNEPVYISDLQENAVYSFATEEGTHQISFRYFDKLYTLNQVKLRSHTKHLFGVNIDSIKKTNSLFSVIDSLPILEPSEKEKQLLYSTMLITNIFYCDSSEVISNNINHQKKYYRMYGIPNLSIDGDNYYIQGPLKSNSVTQVKIDDKTYNLKTGYETFYFYDDILHDFIPKKLGTIKGAFLHFSETLLHNASLLSLLKPDTLVPQPEKAALNYNPRTEKALEIKEEENLFQSYSSSKYGDNFRIIIENKNDTNYIKSIWIVSNTSFESSDYIQSVSKPKFVFTKRNVAETYDIYLFFNKNRMAILRNQKHLASDEFYLNASYIKTEEFTKEKIEVPLKIYAELNSTPLLPFYDTPFEPKEKIKQAFNVQRNNIYVHGMITDDSQQPLSGALVYAEINGKFRYGGITNANGLFEVLDIIPGTYQIKIMHPSYKIAHFAPQVFSGSNEYTINMSLQQKEMTAPLFESIQNDFRFMAFIGKEQENILKISVHEIQSRDLLRNVQINLLYQNTILSTFQLNTPTIEIPFPSIKNRLYTLEITKPGFTTLRIQGLEFLKYYRYYVDAFIGNEKKEILKTKEYSLEMRGILPTLSQELVTENVTIGEEEENSDSPAEIYGRVTDDKNQGLEFATVQAFIGGISKGGTKTDINGNYSIKPLSPGEYNIKVTYVGLNAELIQNIPLGKDSRRKVDVKMGKQSSAVKANKVVRAYRYENKQVDASEPRVSTLTKRQMSEAPTLSTGDFASTSGGAYQRKAGDNISIGGDRSSGIVYMVDGIAVSGNSAKLGFQNDEVEFRSKKNEKEKYADGDMINQVIENKNTSTIRKKFNDVGYWKPNMVTNKYGKTAFTVKLPDNITTWKSYIVGVGHRWLHGTDSAETKVYKPLQTTVIMPNYLYREDKLFAKIKYTNLTKDSLQIVTKILVDQREMLNKKVGIKNTLIDSLSIEAGNKDTLAFEAGLIYLERYKDFEHYDIPIYSTAMKYYSNQSFLMEKDSTYQLRIESNTKGGIIFNNSLFEKVVAAVNELNKYEYGCVEQTTSKLHALLLKERIQKQLKIKEKNNRDIYNMLSRMADMQNTNGSFGWWRQNGTNDRMTIYVMEISHMALQDGFTNNIYNAAKDYITQHYKELSSSDKIYAYNVLLNTNSNNVSIDNEYKKVSAEFLNTTDKIYYYQNKLKLKEDVDNKDLYAVLLEINQKVGRPYYDNFFYDSRADLFKAYSLFKHTPYSKEFINLFRKKLINGQYEKNLNTFSKAKMIEALTIDAMDDSSKSIQSNLLINDTLKVNTFPFRMNITESQYKIKHVGGDVFVNTSEEKWVAKPSVHDSVFGVSTYFMQNKNKAEEIITGVPCAFTIDIQVFKNCEHVMIEIPIPSGMKVTQKNMLYGQGNYVEYYKHKVVYFFEKLTMGTHQYVIQMIPVFKGECMLPATKASLMYYPFVFGNNENKKLIIK